MAVDPKTGISDNQPNEECLDCACSKGEEVHRCYHKHHLKHQIAMPCPTDGKPCADYDPITLAGMVNKSNRKFTL